MYNDILHWHGATEPKQISCVILFDLFDHIKISTFHSIYKYVIDDTRGSKSCIENREKRQVLQIGRWRSKGKMVLKGTKSRTTKELITCEMSKAEKIMVIMRIVTTYSSW